MRKKYIVDILENLIVRNRLLKRLAEKCLRPDVFSVEKLKTLSDAKDFIAKAQINLYASLEKLEEDEKRGLGNTTRAMGEALESFEVYRKYAPQLDLLLSFCVMDTDYLEEDKDTGEYVSYNFQYIDTSEDEVSIAEDVRVGKIKHIAISEDFVEAISDWIDCGGRRELYEASMADSELATIPDSDIIDTEIDWWRDNIGSFEYELEDSDLALMLVRAARNNMLKCKRTKEQVISCKDWTKKVEIL